MNEASHSRLSPAASSPGTPRRRQLWRLLAVHLLRIAVVLLLAALLTATLVRFAPGYGTDERELNPSLSESSIQAIHATAQKDANIVTFYWRFVAGLFRGDLGFSQSLNQPVSTLIKERLPLTLRLLTAGVLGAWIAGLLLAALTVVLRSSSLQAFSRLVSSASLCLPAAAAGVLLFAIGGPAALAIAMAVFPKVFAYAQTLLREAFAKPYAITARASGLSNLNILFRQVLPESGPRLLAVFGISVSLAVGATVPVEAVCDLPGIGQLAWQAAMARDLPLLVALTAIVAAFSLAANAISDIAASPQQGAAA